MTSILPCKASPKNRFEETRAEINQEMTTVLLLNMTMMTTTTTTTTTATNKGHLLKNKTVAKVTTKLETGKSSGAANEPDKASVACYVIDCYCYCQLLLLLLLLFLLLLLSLLSLLLVVIVFIVVIVIVVIFT